LAAFLLNRAMRDELLKHAPKTALGQFEHGRVRVLRDRHVDAPQDHMDVEPQLFPGRHA